MSSSRRQMYKNALTEYRLSWLIIYKEKLEMGNASSPKCYVTDVFSD